jgi:hypothetical protein
VGRQRFELIDSHRYVGTWQLCFETFYNLLKIVQETEMLQFFDKQAVLDWAEVLDFFNILNPNIKMVVFKHAC